MDITDFHIHFYVFQRITEYSGQVKQIKIKKNLIKKWKAGKMTTYKIQWYLIILSGCFFLVFVLVFIIFKFFS